MMQMANSMIQTQTIGCPALRICMRHTTMTIESELVAPYDADLGAAQRGDVCKVALDQKVTDATFKRKIPPQRQPRPPHSPQRLLIVQPAPQVKPARSRQYGRPCRLRLQPRQLRPPPAVQRLEGSIHPMWYSSKPCADRAGQGRYCCDRVQDQTVPDRH